MNRLIKVLAALVAVLALATPVAAQAPIVIEFNKAPAGPGLFVGTADEGTIAMQVTSFEERGNTARLTATLRLTGTSAGTFTAEVTGTLNNSTGRGTLNGVIISGDCAGARIHEESQLIDPATNAYVGTIRVMPAS